MIGPIHRTLTLWMLAARDMLVSAGPVAALAAGLLVAAYWWLDPQPPRTLRLATGPAGSAYAEFGAGYAQALARDGIEVQQQPTAGSQANLQALRDGGADAAFVRGGSADPSADRAAGIVSLGSLFYEPLWIFYRLNALPPARDGGTKPASPVTLARLQGLRVNLDQPGSGVPEIMQRLLAANGVAVQALRVSALAPEAATKALLAGQLDAIVLASTDQSRLVQQLIHAPDIALLDLAHADAYQRLFPFLQTVTLPRGVVDLAHDVPPHDITLLATTTALLARDETHPALRQLLAQAAQHLHGQAGWFNRARDFPNTRTSELPVSPEGDRAINGTPPFWQRYLPFWASNLLDRMWLIVGGLIVLLLPLSRVVPPLYTFRVRRRVFRWYARLRDIEARLEEELERPQRLLAELDELDRVTHRIAVPLAYVDELYALRNNIEAVRRRLKSQENSASTMPERA